MQWSVWYIGGVGDKEVCLIGDWGRRQSWKKQPQKQAQKVEDVFFSRIILFSAAESS